MMFIVTVAKLMVLTDSEQLLSITHVRDIFSQFYYLANSEKATSIKGNVTDEIPTCRYSSEDG